MATFANITPAAQTDGLLYASGVPLTTTEADLYNGVGGDPEAVRYNDAFMAVIQLTLVGSFTSNNTYIVAQTDMGDGVWIDVAWIVLTSTTPGTTTFVLSGGVAGADAFQQTRAAGMAPASNGSNQIAMGGRLRFVGKASLTSSSSSSSSSSGTVIPGITATIRVKQLGLR